AGRLAVVGHEEVGLVLAAVAGVALLRDGGGGDDRPDAVAVDRPGAAAERQAQVEGAGGVRIAGTLTTPPAAGGPVPGVLVIPGFGPTTRDGVTTGGAVDPLYRDITASLARSGMASFRYDKRGAGASTLPDGQPLRFADMIDDAAAGLDLLAQRNGIDAGRLAVVGHEEGGLVALGLAARDPRVAGLVLVSTPGRPLLDVLTDDFANSGHGADVDALHRSVGELLRTGVLPADAELETLPDFFPADQSAYLVDLFALDPVTLAEKVEVPVLMVRGGLATGVSSEDTDRLSAALGPGADVRVSPDAGSTLAVEPGAGATPTTAAPSSGGHDHGAGMAQTPEGTTTTRDRAALDAIAEWLAARLA
ncbi:MAG: alpha/beta hydrolase family protein, partial [Acidimicrobiales bacterium]